MLDFWLTQLEWTGAGHWHSILSGLIRAQWESKIVGNSNNSRAHIALRFHVKIETVLIQLFI